MTEPIINTPTEPARMSPVTRVVRTVLQVLGALVVAVPTAAAFFNVSAQTSAKFVGYMSGVVVIVSAIHNAYNQASDTKANRNDDGQIGVAEALVIAILVLVFLFVVTRLF